MNVSAGQMVCGIMFRGMWNVKRLRIFSPLMVAQRAHGRGAIRSPPPSSVRAIYEVRYQGSRSTSRSCMTAERRFACKNILNVEGKLLSASTQMAGVDYGHAVQVCLTLDRISGGRRRSSASI